MSEINNTRIIRDAIRKISIESVLTEYEALDILSSSLIYTEWYEIIVPKIIDLANKREEIEIIKVHVYSLVSQICVAGGLENYKLTKAFQERFSDFC